MALNFPASPSLNDTYTVGDRTWKFNGTAWDLQSVNILTGSLGYTGSIGYSGSTGVNGYSVTIGDGSSTSIVVNHDLNATKVFTSVREVSSGNYVYPDIIYTNVNSLTINFVTAPTTNQYFVYVFGA